MNNQPNIIIRQAVETNALELAKLIDIAGEGIPTWLWMQSCQDGQSALDVGTQRARRPSGGFSFCNALVAVKDHHILGMVLGYPIDAAPDDNLNDLPPPIAPFVDLEKQSVGTWYVNALAMFPGHRGSGVGTELLLAAEAVAVQSGYVQTSIQVYNQNAGAVRLYERNGYRATACSKVLDHPCQPYYTGDVLLLVKNLGH